MEAKQIKEAHLPTGWRWLEKWMFTWDSDEVAEEVVESIKPKHILWIEKGIESFDRDNSLFVVPYDLERYDGDDFVKGLIELWIRPKSHSATQKVCFENILAFDHKEGYLFVKLN